MSDGHALPSSLVRFHGFAPEQVTDVVLSHLHFDHCGGCTGKEQTGDFKITFPNAKHWVGEKQWRHYLNPNYLETDSFRSEDLIPVFEAGLLHLVDRNITLFDGFDIELYDGHTDDQLVSFIRTGEGELVYPSDVIPTKAHYSVDWISAYDIKPLHSVESKLKLIQKIEENHSFVVFYHDTYNKRSFF